MLIEIQLAHAEPGRRVVLARAMGDRGCLAMALGEADTAEAAEDQARQRLAAQLEALPPKPLRPSARSTGQLPPPAPTQAPPEATPSPLALTPPAVEPVAAAPPAETAAAPTAEPPVEPPMDPEDWSAELANLELQLKRLGWSRDQESTYLLRAFGHGSRSRLTRYSDLVGYLQALAGLSPDDDPARCPVPLRRTDLLGQCDQLLAQLGWDAARGRHLLEAQFGCSSRQQLNDAQLLEFNMQLESELLNSAEASFSSTA